MNHIESALERLAKESVLEDPRWEGSVYVSANGDEDDGRPLIKGEPVSWSQMLLFGLSAVIRRGVQQAHDDRRQEQT